MRERYIANIDFDMKNLNIPKGSILPNYWQDGRNIRFLQKNYGMDCVYTEGKKEKEQEINEFPIQVQEKRKRGRPRKNKE